MRLNSTICRQSSNFDHREVHDFVKLMVVWLSSEGTCRTQTARGSYDINLGYYACNLIKKCKREINPFTGTDE